MVALADVEGRPQHKAQGLASRPGARCRDRNAGYVRDAGTNLLALRRGPATLVYGARDETRNDAVVLADWLATSGDS